MPPSLNQQSLSRPFVRVQAFPRPYVDRLIQSRVNQLFPKTPRPVAVAAGPGMAHGLEGKLVAFLQSDIILCPAPGGANTMNALYPRLAIQRQQSGKINTGPVTTQSRYLDQKITRGVSSLVLYSTPSPDQFA